MGQKIRVPCFDVYNDRPFPEKYTVKDHISNTKLEKGDHYIHPNTAQGSFFLLQSYSKKNLRKSVPRSARNYKRNALMPPGHPIILLKSNLFNMVAVSVKKVYSHSRENHEISTYSDFLNLM